MMVNYQVQGVSRCKQVCLLVAQESLIGVVALAITSARSTVIAAEVVVSVMY